MEKNRLFILFFCVISAGSVLAQTIKTANDAVPYHTSIFSYGINPGWYSAYWSDQQLAEIAAAAGVRSSRLSLPDDFLETNGLQARTREFAWYTEHLQFRDLTVFVGSPSARHRENTIYPGCKEPSKAFRGIYEPAWIRNHGGQLVINPENTYAAYIYAVYSRYGKYISYWEVWNEPDFTANWEIASNPAASGSWWHSPPRAADLPNLQCPVYAYIRMLRVTYEVVKRLNPRQLITTGGIGYESFLEQILNMTDNPNHGEVSAAYPLKAGAYFDVLSFHDYPFYYLASWDNILGAKLYTRHSDAAAAEFSLKRDKYEAILVRHGYNGQVYPRKYMICTEVNIPAKRYPNSTDIGSEEAQRNFTIKSLVGAQKKYLKQLYYFVLGRSAEEKQSNDPYQLMGLYYNLRKSVPGKEQLTPQGVAFKTTAWLLYGFTYSASITREMKLPATIDGAAFLRDKEVAFVLWAKTTTDLSEYSHASYKADILHRYKALTRREWDYSRTLTTVYDARNTISLSGSPVFFKTK